MDHEPCLVDKVANHWQGRELQGPNVRAVHRAIGATVSKHRHADRRQQLTIAKSKGMGGHVGVDPALLGSLGVEVASRGLPGRHCRNSIEEKPSSASLIAPSDGHVVPVTVLPTLTTA